MKTAAMNKKCTNCGSLLAAEASVCPHCAAPQRNDTPGRWRRTALKGAAAVLLLTAVCLIFIGWERRSERAAGQGNADEEPPVAGVILEPLAMPSSSVSPESVVKGAEAVWEDGGKEYRLTLSFYSDEPAEWRTPAEEISVECHPNLDMMTDSILYVWDAQSGENLQQEFAEKAAGITVTGRTLSGKGVAPGGAEQRGPVWRSAVRYNARSGTGGICWTIEMKNGDVIVLSHRMVVSPCPTIIIDGENSELNTSASLQAALDALTPEDLEKKFIIINLPGGLYSEHVVFPAGRYEINSPNWMRVRLMGGLTILGGEMTCNGIQFFGNGGTGITANGHVMLYDCIVERWDTGILVNDGAWVAVHRSTFKNNGIGLHFDSKRSNFYNAEYDWNQFVGNGTAFLLENVPAAPPLAFPGTLFFENGEKFDNRCGKELDLSLARMDG